MRTSHLQNRRSARRDVRVQDSQQATALVGKTSAAGLRLLIAVALVAVLFGLFQHGPIAAQPSLNLLTNPDFEGDYTAFNGDVSRLMAAGWSPWNVQRKAGEPSWTNITPQYLPSARRVSSGSRAQEFYELYAIFTGGVFQQVSVTPGSKLTFSAFVNFWSTDLDDPDSSERPGAVSAQVGIDPTGGTDGESAAIVWGSSESAFYDEYRLLKVEAQAQGDKVTVFVRAIVLDPVRHNHVYVDNAALTSPDGAPTPIVIEPTATPTVTLSATPSPKPATATPTPVVVGSTNTPDPFAPTREGTIAPTLPTQATKIATTAPVASRTPTPSGDFSDLPGRVNYVVQAGDTVGGIAVRFNSRIDAIISLNALSTDGFIRVGQALVIPVPAAATAIPPTTAPTLVIPTLVPPTQVVVQPTPGGSKAPVETAILNGPTVNGIGTYIMQAGDTLEAVARRYKTTVEYLARLNGIVNPSRLVIGQVLAVPGPGNNPPGGTPAPTIIPTVAGQPGPNTPGRHVVQAGENLFRISLRYNVTMDALMRANGITNPNLIYAGQVLIIP